MSDDRLPDPREPLSKMDRLVFGENAKRHPVAGFIIENSMGMGDATAELQAELFCQNLERTHGPEVAAAMRRKLEIAKK